MGNKPFQVSMQRMLQDARHHMPETKGLQEKFGPVLVQMQKLLHPSLGDKE
jgi:hypothetical protein